MYQAHFGLTELPFTLTPNTSFYCDLESHKAAFEVLVTALEAGEGFIKVVGEVGTGKTLLCRKLLNELPERYVTAYIPNPYLEPREMRAHIAREFQVPQPAEQSEQLLTQAIQERLVEISRAGKLAVIIVDEAQALPTETLEALRLVSNLETESRKLLHIVLFGQPELDERLATREHRQLRQRITFSYTLQAMTLPEMARYISHRLHIAGYEGPPLFSARVVRLLHQGSRGVPRLVNILCHKVLLLCYGEGVHRVQPSHVRFAVADTEDVTLSGRLRWWWAAAAVLTAIAVAWWSWQQGWLAEYLV
ncbi:ExeA family protein [Pseudidiomarina insulisalsae]|uniref:AAA family ATPase n=1 Tax=Pseudidiomarina insulisalsae TaxID=575789 RepID=A0A432YNA6_9GAMM|nr:AAA family ATPase [Pseudidiomarina insulisalsae]RUO62423.1 AAA family ATPase [Pseudidiomarina insulisalsae]